MINFPIRIPDCDPHCLLNLLTSYNASICSTKLLPSLGNSDHAIISVSIDFVILKMGCPISLYSLWHFCGDWDSLGVWGQDPLIFMFFNCLCSCHFIEITSFICTDRINLLNLKQSSKQLLIVAKGFLELRNLHMLIKQKSPQKSQQRQICYTSSIQQSREVVFCIL